MFGPPLRNARREAAAVLTQIHSRQRRNVVDIWRECARVQMGWIRHLLKNMCEPTLMCKIR